jgi:hypothetical protein
MNLEKQISILLLLCAREAYSELLRRNKASDLSPVVGDWVFEISSLPYAFGDDGIGCGPRIVLLL